MSPEERHAARFGYGPLAHVRSDGSGMLPAFGGEFQPGMYRSVETRKFANPAPLGLSAFALTTFVLSLINVRTRGLTAPNIVVGLAFGYGGLVQLLAGMWEMAVGNTFGATALSSYGGFWLSFAIIFTPGGFDIEATVNSINGAGSFYDELALYLFGWTIFTFFLLICTLKSTVAFFMLFLTLDITFLLLACGFQNYTVADNKATPDQTLLTAGGSFGLAASFLAWYNALAGLADTSNSFFIVPVIHFPWSQKVRDERAEDRTATAEKQVSAG